MVGSVRWVEETAAVHSPEQLVALEQADLPGPVTAWMKLDTGMQRLG
ncbi:alanine racemase, partial [Klebsiella pneumoniae]